MTHHRGSRFRWLAAAATLVLLVGAGIVALGGNNDKEAEQAKPPPPTRLERHAARAESRLARAPRDPRLLLTATLSWIEAGNDLLSGVDLPARNFTIAAGDLEHGLRTWNPYLRQADGEVTAKDAELAGGAYFTLLEIGSRDPQEIESNLSEAARALRMAGQRRPDLFTLSNVAVYAYFNGEYGRGERAARGAAMTFRSKARQKIVTDQLHAYRQRAETFRRLLQQAVAQQRESGEDLLAEPLKLYSSGAGLNKDDPSD